ncbi:hypothetical protein ACTXT7_003100 [Hymenolepis weldensis]
MKRLGKVSKTGKWVPPPHDLSEINKQQRELTESLNGTKAYFKSRGRNEASFFFESKLTKLYEDGMRKLMARWEDVINKIGDYTEH